MQHGIRRRMPDARDFPPHLDIEKSDLDRGQQQRERDAERDPAPVRHRPRPAQTALPGLRIAGERQRGDALPVIDIDKPSAFCMC
ncbi:MAG TPA: hypothetical protein VFV97_03530 [Rhodanobacteraceae bacterium]|nr:hypothetical protein [Rhodanobacteraceae bacterium]